MFLKCCTPDCVLVPGMSVCVALLSGPCVTMLCEQSKHGVRGKPKPMQMLITNYCDHDAVAADWKFVAHMGASLTRCSLGGPSSMDMLPAVLVMLGTDLSALAVLVRKSAHSFLFVASVFQMSFKF